MFEKYPLPCKILDELGRRNFVCMNSESLITDAYFIGDESLYNTETDTRKGISIMILTRKRQIVTAQTRLNWTT